jgi:hypothetical protein
MATPAVHARGRNRTSHSQRSEEESARRSLDVMENTAEPTVTGLDLSSGLISLGGGLTSWDGGAVRWKAVRSLLA